MMHCNKPNVLLIYYLYPFDKCHYLLFQAFKHFAVFSFFFFFLQLHQSLVFCKCAVAEYQIWVNSLTLRGSSNYKYIFK